MRRFAAVLLVLCVLAGLLCGCANAPTVVEFGTPQDDTPAAPQFLSPLTGLGVSEEVYHTRPVAVMINNLKKSLPQKGISDADLIIECPTEGETGRLLAVFTDYHDTGDIGTVRSSRDYFIDYAEGLGAVYLHFGGSPQAYTELKKKRVDWLDGMKGNIASVLYRRDAERMKSAGYEHSVFTSGAQIEAALEEFEIAATVDAPMPFFNFGEAEPAGEDAAALKLSYSYYLEPEFRYDAESGNYLRFQYGAPHIDAGAENAQLAFKNVFVVYAETAAIRGDEAGRITVKTAGEGEGLYLTGGKAQKITWKKAGNKDFLHFYNDLGDEVTAAPGKICICVVPQSRAAKTKLMTTTEKE